MSKEIAALWDSGCRHACKVADCRVCGDQQPILRSLIPARPSKPLPSRSRDEGSGVALLCVIVNVADSDDPNMPVNVPSVSIVLVKAKNAVQLVVLIAMPVDKMPPPEGSEILTAVIGPQPPQPGPVSLALVKLVIAADTPVPVITEGMVNEKLDAKVPLGDVNVYTTFAETGRANSAPRTAILRNPTRHDRLKFGMAFSSVLGGTVGREFTSALAGVN